MVLELKNDIGYLLDIADTLQIEATKNNIISVFDDGGFRELVLTRMFGLTKMSGRHGDDGIDEMTGKHYELKTVNLIDTKGGLRKRPGVTTCHHMNYEVINRYRKVAGFIVGIFYINDPVRVYEVPISAFEDDLLKWEDRLKNEPGLTHINNPKFSFDKIVDNGILHYCDSNYDAYFEMITRGKKIKANELEQLAFKLAKLREKDIDENKVEGIKNTSQKE